MTSGDFKEGKNEDFDPHGKFVRCRFRTDNWLCKKAIRILPTAQN